MIVALQQVKGLPAPASALLKAHRLKVTGWPGETPDTGMAAEGESAASGPPGSETPVVGVVTFTMSAESPAAVEPMESSSPPCPVAGSQ